MSLKLPIVPQIVWCVQVPRRVMFTSCSVTPGGQTRSSQKKDDKFGAVEIVQDASSHLQAVFLSNNSTKADTVPKTRQEY